MSESKKVQISNRQLWFILFMIRTTVILASLPVLTLSDSRQDAWISSLLTLLGSEVFVLLIAYLDSRFPGVSLVEYSQQLLGKWVGKIISLTILFLFLEVSLVKLRFYAEVVSTGFLPETPMWFITGLMIINAIYCVHLGLETLARASDLLFFIFVFSIISLILIPLPEIRLNNIQPVLARGWQPVIRGALIPIGMIKQAWVITLLGDKIEKPEKIISTALSSFGASLLVLAIVAFIVVAVLGPHVASSSVFPSLTLLRSVQLSEFLQRTEAILIVAWGLGVFVSLSIYLYSGSSGLAELLKVKKQSYLLIPMALIWIYLTTYLFESMADLYAFLAPDFFVPYSFSILIIPLMLLYSGYAVKILKDKSGSEK